MPRKKKVADETPSLLDITAKLRSGPCVPPLREALKAWQTGGRKGITDTTRTLLDFWFQSDHKLKTGRLFKYHPSQQEAIETLIYVWEVEKVRTRKDLLERYAQSIADLRLPPDDGFARYCTKMATGSGKTKVMALAIAWQYFNAAREQEEIAKDYARTFLLVAPNVIVLERLKADFANGKIFREDPIRPKEFEIFWDFDCVMRGDGERAHSEGVLFLTNIQQFYERPERGKDDEPDVMTDILGPKPPTQKMEQSDFADRIARREGRLLVVNDEAHHTHDEGSEWNAVIGRLHEKTPITAQLDFSATPRFTKGSIWSRKVFESRKCVLNMIPCDNDFEKAFARFLENAPDIRAFSKLPQPFGFSIDYTDGGMNLRSYYPDFVAIDKKGAHWLIETKGMETTDVGHKDLAATHWCENATALTETKWKYVKVPQKAFEVLQPARLADLAALGAPGVFEG